MPEDEGLTPTEQTLRQIARPVVEALERLPDVVEDVRTVAFESIRKGKAADPWLVATKTGRSETEIRDALELMTSVGAAKLDGAGRIVGVHGLSVEPTVHELTLDGVCLYTWCAIDAIGIPVALGADATARTRCPECGKAIEVSVRSGAAVVAGEPVTWLPTAEYSNLADGLCRQLNLFCDRDHLEAWRRRSGNPDGVVLSVADVEENGRRVWGDGVSGVLDGDAKECCDCGEAPPPSRE
jgi:hypothetical protein